MSRKKKGNGKPKTAESRSVKTKKTLIVCLIAVLYLVIAAAAAILIDDRHIQIIVFDDTEMTAEAGEPYTDAGAVAYLSGNLFGRSKNNIELTCESDVDTSRIGDYSVKYSAAALGRTAVSYRVVHVRDTTPPVIELHHEEGYVASWLVGYTEEGFTANDSFEGDLTDRVIRTEADDAVYYTVSDSSGNETTVVRPIEYGVSQPLIRLRGGDEITVGASFSFSDPGYEAIDGSGNDLTPYVQVTGTVTPYLTGDYELHYHIMNEQGETATADRIVHIVPQEMPETVIPQEKTIYLTFDDGPGPYTEQLLDILKKYGVKATFFVTDQFPDYEYLIGRAYEEGHSIGVHTYTHEFYQLYANEQAYFNDFLATEDLIYRQTGSYTKLFRFPGGSSNEVSRNYNYGIMTRLTKIMTDMGYVYFDWNVVSGDAGETTSTNQVINNVASGCSEHTVCIVLQHDIKQFSVNAVERIIVWGRNNGYTFKALDETSYGAHHGLNN